MGILLAPNYDRLGAVYLSQINAACFFKGDPQGHYISHHVVDVDPLRFGPAWYKNSATSRVGSPPGPVDEWAPEQLAFFVWEFLRGPRFPTTIPHVDYDRKADILEVDQGRLVAQALLDWGAKALPITVKSTDVLTLGKAMGSPERTPIPENQFNEHSSSQKVLMAFEARLSPANLYKAALQEISTKRKLENSSEISEYISNSLDEIKNGILIYNYLLDCQLQVMTVRAAIRPDNDTEFFVAQRSRDLAEVRRLLHQKAIIGNWLTNRPDMDNLPTWEPQENVPELDAVRVLKKSVSEHREQYSGTFVQDMRSITALDEHKKQPSRPSKLPSHLRVVEPNNPNGDTPA